MLLFNADPRPPQHPLRDHVLRFTETMIGGLRDRYRVVVMSYPGPATTSALTPDGVSDDMLRIADAAGAGDFAWWGYSWGGVAGLQLALRTDRLTALAMTGFPPLGGPYREMLHYSRALADVELDAFGQQIPEEQRAQLTRFVTYYEHLAGFDDRAAQQRISCPRLCFVGGEDRITAGTEPIADLGAIVTRHQAELEALGWSVEVIPGEDHLGAMSADVVLPRLAHFLDSDHPGTTP
ncbi:alpha/beta fold hydrolase [Saccharopolyspora spinosporotrichia]